ncbi:response regulator [Aquibium sp. LZ166]|uniref:histidine kinase n=1 Tax=Aquibium pacificus TaxID=3153579 RepID=A0ABV3SJ19_9HYPH
MSRSQPGPMSRALIKPDDNATRSTSARILVVDDDDRNLLSMGEVLSGLGELDYARSGEEALRYLLRQDYAVILLDVIMPGLDGYQTAQLLRQRESSRSTPIIFLTAINKEDAHMLRGYDAGAVDFLFKPFDPVMLRSKVSVFVDLYEKTREIKQKAAVEQRLLEANLRANAQKLEAVRALRRSEERQEVILKSLPLCIRSRGIEAPHPTRFISGAVERLTGFPAEAFTAEPGFEASRIHPEDLPRVTEALEAAVRTGSYVAEFRWKCADGSYRRFLDQGVVSTDEDGQPSEISGTLLDVTERRHLEDQLIHAQKLDAIGKLTGGVAHDFNNLLGSILSGLSLLQRKVDMGDDAVRVFEMTQKAAKQGADLIARMLTFSRRQHLKPENYDLLRLAETLSPLLESVLGGRLKLTWDFEPDVWSAYVDPGQLELAVMNLVINARDAMPEGGSVVIEARNHKQAVPGPELPAGEYAVLRVVDNGSGIEPEHLAKVIEPFFTTKEVGRGTGLGLSTAYGFAKQSGGALRVQSVVNEGTTVELWFPRAQTGSMNSVLPEKGPRRSSTAGTRKPAILLVDDTPELREFTRAQLAEHGFAVTAAGGGAEALMLLEKHPHSFDVIVTDFAMPLVSGLEVIRFARNMRSGLPAIIITGYVETQVIGDRPSDVPLIRKPFEFDVLIEAIERVCARDIEDASELTCGRSRGDG